MVGTRYPAQRLTDYRGLVRDEPGAGWPLAFALVALAGLPPGIIGLLAKVVVLDAAAGPATWLAVVMARQRRDRAGLLRPLAGASCSGPAGSRAPRATTYPTGVAVAIGMTFTAGVVFSVLPRLAARPRPRRPPVVRDGLQVPLRFFLHSVTDYPDGALEKLAGWYRLEGTTEERTADDPLDP